MTRLDGDVTQLNDFIMAQLDELRARQEVSNDSMINLFKRYMTITDSQYKTYITQKMHKYDKGGNLSEGSLMTLAKNKYEIFLRSGEWKALNDDQKEVPSLNSQVKDLKKMKDHNHNSKMNRKKKEPKIR